MMSETPIREMKIGQLTVEVYEDNAALGRAAAEATATILTEAIAQRGTANAIIATGNSQLSFLKAVRERSDVAWPAVTLFHMDEYLNLPPGHAAGFSSFLHRHLMNHVPVERFYPVPGHPSDIEAACRGYELLLHAHPADLCCLGIGENGHLAFNEPEVADFDDPVWMKVVTLNAKSRQQQVGEGHYASLDEVPQQALSLTIPALRSAKHMLCMVPESRKAQAVYDTLYGPITTDCPGSILRESANAVLLLDQDSAAKIL
jgi:glucosamine-6-phosphate deaminase